MRILLTATFLTLLLLVFATTVSKLSPVTVAGSDGSYDSAEPTGEGSDGPSI